MLVRKTLNLIYDCLSGTLVHHLQEPVNNFKFEGPQTVAPAVQAQLFG